ncbi:MAG: hypothetical protein HY228_02545 [Candidatus Yonathbacteria bacterium]|nr:hypothetical protein [Candidatus Yonathbacteria bacterium]
MLYIIHGTDREKGQTKFRALREKLSVAGMNIEDVQEENVSEKMLGEMSASRGLFGDTTLFIFNNILAKKEEQEIFASCGELLKNSDNYFLVFEPLLSKDIAKDLAPSATEYFEYTLGKNDTRPSFNIFSLGDALGERNKKELWVLYQRAIGAGFSSEEISGTLFWAIKNIALMKQAKSRVSIDTERHDSAESDCGLNPFVARKTRVFASHYTMEEIVSLSRNIVTLYHEAHRGGEPIDIALERFILSI